MVYQPKDEGADAPIELPRPLTPVTDAPVGMRPSPRRLPSWLLPALVAALSLALVTTGTWGFITTNDLSAARATIDQQNLRIAGLQTDLAQEKTRGDGLAASVANLQARVKNQDACIGALAIDASTLNQIAAKQTTLSNMTAKGSTWANASLARDAAEAAALDDYYQAYRAAWDGSYSSANTWVARGNTQIKEASRQLDVMNAEIAKADQLVDEVDGMLGSYATGSDLSVCTAPSSGSST